MEWHCFSFLRPMEVCDHNQLLPVSASNAKSFKKRQESSNKAMHVEVSLEKYSNYLHMLVRCYGGTLLEGGNSRGVLEYRGDDAQGSPSGNPILQGISCPILPLMRIRLCTSEGNRASA